MSPRSTKDAVGPKMREPEGQDTAMDHQIDRDKAGSKSRGGHLFTLCSIFVIRSILPLLLLASRIVLMDRQKEAIELLSDMAAGRHVFDSKLARAVAAQKAARGIATRNEVRLRKTLPPMVQAYINCHQGFRAHDREFATH